MERNETPLTREQYLKRSKEHALALLEAGRLQEAVASMMMAMRKSPNCGAPHEIHTIGIVAAAEGDAITVRDYIERFF